MSNAILILALCLVALAFPTAAYVGAVPSLLLWLTGGGIAYAEARRGGF